MKLLELQPEVAPGAPPEPPEDAPREAPQADPGARTCTHCGATMDPGQDWCLACGTAAGPLGERPGWRSAMTVLGLTLVLVAGAVAASYAALRSDPAASPATSNAQVAQPPAATTPPPAATTALPETTPTTPGKTSTGKLPKVQVPSSKPSTSAPKPATPATPAPTPAPPRATTPPAQAAPPPSGGGRTNSTPTNTTPAAPAPAAIDLDASAASVYDPYRRATAVGVPGKALDGDGGTSWFVDPAPGDKVAVGYALNLGEARGIKAVDITTPTPGFRVEVYATDEATPPPNILDTRWAHITDKANVGEGGKTHIVLGGGTSKYQTLLLWITEPPSDGARVRISELKVLG